MVCDEGSAGPRSVVDVPDKASCVLAIVSCGGVGADLFSIFADTASCNDGEGFDGAEEVVRTPGCDPSSADLSIMVILLSGSSTAVLMIEGSKTDE